MLRLVLVMAALLLLMVGCEEEGPAPVGTGQPAQLLPGQWTGVLNQAAVEAFVVKQLRLTKVSLSSTGQGNYTGTGTGTNFAQPGSGPADYTFEVAQVSGGIKCTWRSGPMSGTSSSGNPVGDAE